MHVVMYDFMCKLFNIYLYVNFHSNILALNNKKKKPIFKYLRFALFDITNIISIVNWKFYPYFIV
jgi:hypothetical protein